MKFITVMVLVMAAALAGCQLDQRALRSAGIRHYQAGQIPQAKEAFRRLLDHYPGDSEGLYALGRVHHSEGNCLQAIYYYRAALDTNPAHDRASVWLEKAQQDSGRPAKNFDFDF